jgi:hypothetical protein
MIQGSPSLGFPYPPDGKRRGPSPWPTGLPAQPFGIARVVRVDQTTAYKHSKYRKPDVIQVKSGPIHPVEHYPVRVRKKNTLTRTGRRTVCVPNRILSRPWLSVANYR